MKYQISSLKKNLNELGVFNIRILEPMHTDYANWIDLSASQFIAAQEIKHKINALTLEDAFLTLQARAKAIVDLFNQIKVKEFKSPDISVKNMIGHIKDGNFEVVNEPYCAPKD